jgi:hypothetical protein
MSSVFVMVLLWAPAITFSFGLFCVSLFSDWRIEK